MVLIFLITIFYHCIGHLSCTNSSYSFFGQCSLYSKQSFSSRYKYLSLPYFVYKDTLFYRKCLYFLMCTLIYDQMVWKKSWLNCQRERPECYCLYTTILCICYKRGKYSILKIFLRKEQKQNIIICSLNRYNIKKYCCAYSFYHY